MKPLRCRYLVSPTILGVLFGTHLARAEWKELGPSPLGNGDSGRVISVAPHPTDGDIFFLGAATGGVWKYQSGAYTPLTDRMPFGAIGAVAIDPRNPSVSTDGGANWTVLGGPTFGGRAISKIIVSPTNGQIVYAAVTRGGDGYPGGITATKDHPGASGPMGVFRSSDGGATWAPLTSGIPAVAASDLAMVPADPNTVYAAIGSALGNPGNGIYKTTNGGDSWTKLGGGLPTSTGRITLAMAPSNPSRLYAAMAGPGNDSSAAASRGLGVFVTSNAGTTWTATNPGDAGGNYSNVTALHTDNHAFAFLANGDLLVGQDGGINRSSNGGDTWTRQNAGLAITQLYAGISIHPGQANFILGGFQDNGTNLRGATNSAWRRVLGGDGGYTALHPLDPMVMFAEIYDATNLYRSTNAGQSFQPASNGISGNDRTAFYDLIVATPDDPKTLLLATHRVYKSTNQGTSWTPISGDLTGGAPAAIRALAVAPTNAQIVWAATNDDRVLVSTNGGVNFTRKLDAPGWKRVTREIAIAPWDDKVAFVAVPRFGVDQVRMTKNLGDAWTGIDGDLPDVPANTVDAAVVGGQQMIFVGTDRGVYFSCNEGQHWALLGQALPNTMVSDVRYDATFKRVIASTMGRGVWSIEEPTAANCTGPGGIDAGGAGGAGGQDGGGQGGVAGGAGGTSGGTSGVGGASTASGGGVGAGGATSGDGGAKGGAGNLGIGTTGEDSGCACSVASSRGQTAVTLIGLGTVAAFMRRRRRS